MRKIVEEVVANENRKKRENKDKKSEEKNDILRDSLTRDTIGRGIKNKELEEVLEGLVTKI